jgi:cytochrome oxidase Cu insertion factor (SCO1/SenC/PrrC family)
MKKPILIAVLCCALPLGVIFFYSSGSTDRSSMKQQPESRKVDASIGNIFPDFSVIDIEGASLSHESLKGKPTIIWFTTSWCTPCQIGAKKVAQLQKELGTNKLHVLVFFVDPRESENDLRNWRSQFANPDWKLAFNNGLAEKIGIRYLDSKYLLGTDGVVKDFNTIIADDQYLALIRSAVNASQ